MCYFVVLYILSLMAHSFSQHATNAIFYNFSNNDLRYGSCKLRSVRETMNQRTGSSMTESFVLDDIEYKLCRYHVTWDEAQVFCSTHEAHLATLDNGEKTSFVVRAIAASDSHSEDYWIGARKYYGDLWTWDSNQQQLTSSSNIIDNIAIFYPGTESNDVRCLTIDRRGHDVPIFVPRSCNQQRGFICQRDTDRGFDNKIKMVAASKIGKEEFRLYSGRATWAEAVVQCREEGLQIAEVKSVAEAQALALSMLRNRPLADFTGVFCVDAKEGIESAWIGGYTRKSKPGTWRWLASGERIKDNEMWQKNLSQSHGGCLLLDRHLCEIPVYVKAKCDRKRDVLCQKTLKKRASKQPVGVIVGGFSYWIGFHPLKWSEARKSCESINASLVVLDSPEKISHMMSLMLDNREELRHIWTDGRRTKSGQWRWELNGQIVPAFGKSFMPWCPDDTNHYANELNCLNLDRDNPDIPLVYGLSCNEKQSYVCQPRTGESVSHLVGSPSGEPDVESSEGATIQKLEIDRSGSSGTMSMGIEDWTTPRARNTVGFLQDGLDDSQLEGNPSTKATTSGGNLSNYLTPLARFTFPSLPQFGIQLLASALETSTQPLAKYENQRTKKVKEFFKASSPPRKSTISPKFSTTGTRRFPFDTRKPSQVALKKIPTNFETTSSKKMVENLTTIRPKSRPRNSTRKYPNSSSGTPKFSTSPAIPETQNYPRRTTRELINNVASKSPRKTLQRITTPLPKKRKRLRLTTSSITPYDAVDQDYYDAYETTEAPEPEEKSNIHSGDEYEENYDIPEKNEDAKQPKKTSISNLRKSHTPDRKSSKKNEIPKKNKDKFDIPVVGEFSRSLQTALMDMLTKSVSRKMSESKEKLEKSTTTLPEIIENSHNNAPREKPSEKPKENWSIRPYYAFEGPLIVGLSGSSSQSANSEIGSNKAQSFKFVGKKVPDTSKNGERRAPKIVENRRSQLDNSRPNDKNVEYRFPLPISGGLPIANNPEVFLEMGRYLKNTFAHLNVERTEENSSPEGPRERIEKKNSANNYNAFPEKSRNENAKPDPNEPRKVISGLKLTYDKNGRKIDTYGKYDATLTRPPVAKSYEKSWQEKLQVSWPEETFSNPKNPVLDETANGRKNYPFLLRKTRSSGENPQIVKIEDSIFDSLPDFKMSKIMKEVRFDFDQKSLRNNLETLSDKISGEYADESRKKNWKDSWKYILARISKLLDRLNFNVNGNLLKIRIGSSDDEESRETEMQSSEESTSRKHRNFLKFESPNVHSDSLEFTDRKTRGFTDHLPEIENGPNFFQRYQTSSRSSKNNRLTNFRKIMNENKFRNRYTHKFATFNDSRISAAPAVIRPIESSEFYSFQSIMHQLHRRLAFNQGLNRFHASRRPKNIGPNGLLLKGEYLPKGTMSRIVRLKNASHESQGADNDGRNHLEDDSTPENDTVPSTSLPKKIPSVFFSPGNSGEDPSSPTRFEKNREVLDRNLVGRISTNILILKEKTEFQKNGLESENDRGRDEIVNYLDGLSDEPSMVSLKLTMDPEETARGQRSSDGASSSHIAESPRIVNLQVKFSGKSEKSEFQNKLKKKELDKRDNGKSSSRLRNKSDKLDMIEKLRKLSRLFPVRNTSLIWRSENQGVPVNTQFRKSQLAESLETEQNSGREVRSKNSSVQGQDAADFRAGDSSLEKVTLEEKSKSNEKR